MRLTFTTCVLLVVAIICWRPPSFVVASSADAVVDEHASVTTTVRDYMLPDDWTSYGNKQYLFVMDDARGRDLNRGEALAACQSVGSQLVSVDTEDEFEMLKKEIRQRVIRTGQEFVHERWWTAGRSIDNRWVWDRPNNPSERQSEAAEQSAVEVSDK